MSPIELADIRNERNEVVRNGDNSVWREYEDTDAGETGTLFHYSGSKEIRIRRGGHEDFSLEIGNPKIADLMVTEDDLAVGAIKVIRQHGKPVVLPPLGRPTGVPR